MRTVGSHSICTPRLELQEKREAQSKLVRLVLNKGEALA